MTSSHDFPASFISTLTRAVELRHATPIQGGRELRFQCPTPEHEDQHPSACWNPESAVWRCHVCGAGGGAIDLARLLGVPLPDRDDGRPAFPRTDPRPASKPRPIQPVPPPTYYEYQDEQGQALFRVVRRNLPNGKKDIHQERWTGSGWAAKLQGVRLVPYRLPELIRSSVDDPVFVVEGEKCADALARLGCVATTNSGGAGKWLPEYRDHFRDRDVIVLPDNDEPGRKHGASVVASLGPVAESIQIVTLPGLSEKGDIADWLAMGQTLDDLAELVEGNPDPWSADTASETDGETDGETDSETTEDSDSDETEPWPEIIPLDNGPLPDFPAHQLGSPVAEFVEALATETQTPQALAGGVALGVLSATLGGKYLLHAGSGWTEPVNLYQWIFLDSGNRKSSVFRTACRPIVEYERERATSDRMERSRWEAKRRIAEQEYNAAIKKADTGGETEALQAESAKIDLDQMRPPRITQIIFDDVTPEAMSVALADQGGAIAVMSAEGGLVANVGGRYTNAPNFDVLLKAHEGDELRVNRVGREGEYVSRPAATICIAAQPVVASEMGKISGFRAKGGPARFLSHFPPSPLGSRSAQSRPVPDHLTEQWHALVRSLLDLQRSTTTDASGDRLPNPIHLSGAARRVLHAFQEEIEPQLGRDGALAGLTDWGSKLPGAALRIAGLLHVAGCVAASQPVSLTMRADTMERAVAIARYFIPHAIVFFEQVEQSGSNAARQVLDKLLDMPDDPTNRRTRRRLHQLLRQRPTFKVSSSLDAPLRLLEEYGYIRVAKITGPDGGRPTEVITLSPLTQNPQNTQNPPRWTDPPETVVRPCVESKDYPDTIASD